MNVAIAEFPTEAHSVVWIESFAFSAVIIKLLDWFKKQKRKFSQNFLFLFSFFLILFLNFT